MFAAVASCLVWLAAAGMLYLSRRPAEPFAGPTTLELSSEPPAVANFLVHGFRVTHEAVPATLIDLAARNVVDVEWRGPAVFYVRLRRAVDASLTAYERRVLEHLQEIASDGVVPAQALTTGPAAESKKWWRRFEGEVIADAQRRGLSRDALDSGLFTVLLVAAAIPALLAYAAAGAGGGLGVWVGSGALLTWIRGRHPQQETTAGLEAAGRWLGVRTALAEDEEFSRQSPLTVELWDRLLAYGAALGVARTASGALPMGAESDTSAWSAQGGSWRNVQVSYPRFFPPGWGREPVTMLGVGLVVALGCIWFLYTFGFPLDTALGGLVPFTAACVGAVVGPALVVMSGKDLRNSTETTGPIIRLRALGDDDSLRYYLAVDDGSSRYIRAFRVSERQYGDVREGENVTVRFTPNLGRVRWIIPATDGV